MASTSRSFKDFDLSFRKNPVTDDVNTLKNEAAIKEAVKNIVRYNFYEKPFLPAFGGNLYTPLFELWTSGNKIQFEERVKTLINAYEPRVVCYDVKVNFTEDQNDLNVEIYYLITGLPNVIDNIAVILKK